MLHSSWKVWYNTARLSCNILFNTVWLVHGMLLHMQKLLKSASILLCHWCFSHGCLSTFPPRQLRQEENVAMNILNRAAAEGGKLTPQESWAYQGRIWLMETRHKMSSAPTPWRPVTNALAGHPWFAKFKPWGNIGTKTHSTILCDSCCRGWEGAYHDLPALGCTWSDLAWKGKIFCETHT